MIYLKEQSSLLTSKNNHKLLSIYKNKIFLICKEILFLIFQIQCIKNSQNSERRNEIILETVCTVQEKIHKIWFTYFKKNLTNKKTEPSKTLILAWVLQCIKSTTENKKFQKSIKSKYLLTRQTMCSSLSRMLVSCLR